MRPPSNMVPVKIAVEFPQNRAGDPGSKDVRENQRLSFWTDTDLSRILITPADLIAKGVDLFAHKRAFRWLTFRIERDAEVLKLGSFPIRDRFVFEIPPIEIEAPRGSVLKASLSLLQVDFMDGRHGDLFCEKGAPGLVRTWSGEQKYEVTGDGNFVLQMQDAGMATVHMAAVRFDSAAIRDLKVGDARHMILDTLTGQRFDQELCPVSEIPVVLSDPTQATVKLDPNATVIPFRYLRTMIFTRPLRSHMLGLYSPTFKTMLAPAAQDDPPAIAPADPSVSEMNITAAAVADPNAGTGENLKRLTPQELFGNTWYLDPRVTIEPLPTTQISQADSIAMKLLLSRPDGVTFDPKYALRLATTGDVRCSFVFEPPSATYPASASVKIYSCLGNGSVSLQLLEGFMTTGNGQRSLFADAPEIIVNNSSSTGTPTNTATPISSTTQPITGGTVQNTTQTVLPAQ